MHKRGDIKRKVIIFLVINIFLIVIPLVSSNSNLSSETPLEKWKSNLSKVEEDILQKNILKYEERILEEFAKLKYPESNQTNITEIKDINQTFIKIIIRLTNKSEADNLFSSFLEEELFHIVNRPTSSGIGVRITEEGFFKLIQDKRIEKVFFNRPLYFTLDKSAPLINATYAWNTLGYTGNGVKICVIDSGVNASHLDLSGKIIDEYSLRRFSLLVLCFSIK